MPSVKVEVALPSSGIVQANKKNPSALCSPLFMDIFGQILDYLADDPIR